MSHTVADTNSISMENTNAVVTINLKFMVKMIVKCFQPCNGVVGKVLVTINNFPLRRERTLKLYERDYKI